MTIHAFKDADDGYYQVDVPDGEPMPAWTKTLTPCDVAPPPAPSLAELKADKRADLIADCESAIAAIRAGYPDSEVLSWSKQEAEARALVADANAATPLLDALAEARGIAKAELAVRVIAKADAFAAISGALIGKRQRLEDELDALPADATSEQVAAIVW